MLQQLPNPLRQLYFRERTADPDFESRAKPEADPIFDDMYGPGK